MNVALIITLSIFGYLLIGTVIDIIGSATNENMETAEWHAHLLCVMFWLPCLVTVLIIEGRKSAIEGLKKRRRK